MSEAFAALRQRFETVPFHATLGLRVEAIDTDRVLLRVPFKDEIANPGRALHGGVAASAIDIAGALAAWSGVEGAGALEAGTIDLSVDYLAAAIGEDIVATAEVLRRGKELVYSDVDVRNDAGKRIARGLVTYRLFDHAAVPAARDRQLSVAPEPLPQSGELIPGAEAFVSLGLIAHLGITVSHAHAGVAVLGLPAAGAHDDAAGATHEGALAALIDTAGALASWSIVGLNMRHKASTAGIHVSYHAPARGEAVVAQARTLRRNNEIFLNAVTVSGRTSGRIIAAGTVTYRIVMADR